MYHVAVSCPACGAPGPVGETVAVPDREYAVAAATQYLACEGCGSLVQDPMPPDEALGGFYPADYHAVTGQGMLTGLRLRLRHRTVRRLAGEEGTLLDFGCGNGEFLRYVATRDLARRCYGYEIAASTEVSTEMDGRVTIVRGDPDALLERLPAVELITMNHVIEHLPCPLRTLTGLRSALSERGTLQGQTPAAGSLEHRVFGTKWSGFHAPRQMVVFSPEGLRRVLTEAGFDTVSVDAGFNPAALAVSLASLRQGSGGGRIRRGGASWMFYLLTATVLAPIDRIGGPGVVDFAARAGSR